MGGEEHRGRITNLYYMYKNVTESGVIALWRLSKGGLNSGG